jgi:hypothetical protein
MGFKHSMYDGDILARDLVDGDITNFVPGVRRVDEEKEVPAVKCRFHRAAVWAQSADSVSWRRVTWREVAAHLRTTTIGDSVFVISPRPFQIIKPDVRTEAKLRI